MKFDCASARLPQNRSIPYLRCESPVNDRVIRSQYTGKGARACGTIEVRRRSTCLVYLSPCRPPFYRRFRLFKCFGAFLIVLNFRFVGHFDFLGLRGDVFAVVVSFDLPCACLTMRRLCAVIAPLCEARSCCDSSMVGRALCVLSMMSDLFSHFGFFSSLCPDPTSKFEKPCNDDIMNE